MEVFVFSKKELPGKRLLNAIIVNISIDWPQKTYFRVPIL